MDHQVRLLFHELADVAPGERKRIMAERQVAPELRAEVESLLSFDSRDLRHLTACVSRAAEEILHSVVGRELPDCGPYRLVRLIGQGGMGEVYLGERTDGEIQTTVAVKLLSVNAHRPEWRDRFLKERQLLASLNHPSIVHVIDAGRTGDGRLYLVMEYVNGVSIDLYAATIDVRDRLLLFLGVCEAVAHAHQRLIIHRDLKPSNILVEAGQPKLLDFGIARILDDTGDATRTADRLLTPNYASPEQLRGASQTTATDVYSLGAVLYKMLAGRSPHESDTHTSQAVDVVAGTREITAPSRLNRKLPADLDYILRKALRLKPEDRYASVDAFANDIRAFLGSRPIEARSGDTWYRTRRFLLRYWVPVVAATLVIASLSTGLYLANRQRLIAEQRFGQLRQLSNKVFDLDRAIRDVPGSMKARQSLVAVSLEYLEGLTKTARDDLDLAREIGQGYWRVGRIQGVPLERNLGERAKAEASLMKATEFVERVLDARPKDRSALYLSAIIANDRMVLAQEDQRYPDALAHAKESAGRLDAFLLLGGAEEAERASVSRVYGNIAVTYLSFHMYEEAIPYAQREVEIGKSIGSRVPGNANFILVANAMRRGDLEVALRGFQEARKITETGASPTETARNIELYGILWREGTILGGDGEVNLDRPADAIHAYQKAFDLAENVARQDPQDAASRARSAKAGMALANILRHRDPQRALAVYDVVLRRLNEIQKSLPTKRTQALALANSSYALRSLARVSEARQRIDAALATMKDTRDFPTEDYDFDRATYSVFCAMADHESETGDPRRAVEIYEQLLDRVTAAKPSALTDLSPSLNLSRLYEALTRLYRRIGNPVKAESMRVRRLELWQDWGRKLPNSAFVRRQIEAASR